MIKLLKIITPILRHFLKVGYPINVTSLDRLIVIGVCKITIIPDFDLFIDDNGVISRYIKLNSNIGSIWNLKPISILRREQNSHLKKFHLDLDGL